MSLLFRTRPPWPRQPRACVNGARYDIISLLGRSVTLVTFHSVDASEIDCCVPRGHGSGCGRYCCKSRKSNDAKKSRESRFLDVCISTTCDGADTRVPGRLCVKRCGPSRRRLRNASAALKNFVPMPKSPVGSGSQNSFRLRTIRRSYGYGAGSTSSSLAAFARAKYFAINVLTADQRELSQRFSSTVGRHERAQDARLSAYGALSAGRARTALLLAGSCPSEYAPGA